MKKECVAMLLAGGQGSRLYVLTGDMASLRTLRKFRIMIFPCPTAPTPVSTLWAC